MDGRSSMCGGGSSNPIKNLYEDVKGTVEGAVEDTKEFVEAPRKKTKKFFKSNAAEDIVEGAIGLTLNPMGYSASKASEKAGFETELLFDPMGSAAGELAEANIDKPKAEAQQMAKDAAEARIAQQAQINRLNRRRRQEEATSEAGKRLRRGRALQERRRAARSKRGRAGTILTSELGRVGGLDSDNRKTILGS